MVVAIYPSSVILVPIKELGRQHPSGFLNRCRAVLEIKNLPRLATSKNPDKVVEVA
jgi:hypothetical protein